MYTVLQMFVVVELNGYISKRRIQNETSVGFRDKSSGYFATNQAGKLNAIPLLFRGVVTA